MVVPDRICLQHPRGGDRPLLPVSSAIAIFDDLSSYCFLIKDRNYRSGVSIDLSAELLRDVPAGSTIHVVSQVTKIGRSIGFSDLHMYNQQNELVARGYHTKFLPMGTAWDVMTHPTLSDTTLKLYDSVYVKYKDTGIGKALAKLALGGRNRDFNELPEFNGTGSVFKSFGLNAVAPIQTRETLHKSQCKHSLEVVESNAFSLNVLPFMCNIRGFLHGGCAAMTIEHAINLSKAATGSAGRLYQMNVQYLNGIKVCNVYFSTSVVHHNLSVIPLCVERALCNQ